MKTIVSLVILAALGLFMWGWFGLILTLWLIGGAWAAVSLMLCGLSLLGVVAAVAMIMEEW